MSKKIGVILKDTVADGGRVKKDDVVEIGTDDFNLLKSLGRIRKADKDEAKLVGKNLGDNPGKEKKELPPAPTKNPTPPNNAPAKGAEKTD